METTFLLNIQENTLTNVLRNIILVDNLCHLSRAYHKAKRKRVKRVIGRDILFYV